MISKIIALMLILLVAMAFVGGLRRRKKGPQTAACRACGRPKIGKGPCDCGRG